MPGSPAHRAAALGVAESNPKIERHEYPVDRLQNRHQRPGDVGSARHTLSSVGQDQLVPAPDAAPAGRHGRSRRCASPSNNGLKSSSASGAHRGDLHPAAATQIAAGVCDVVPERRQAEANSSVDHPGRGEAGDYWRGRLGTGDRLQAKRQEARPDEPAEAGIAGITGGTRIGGCVIVEGPLERREQRCGNRELRTSSGQRPPQIEVSRNAAPIQKGA